MIRIAVLLLAVGACLQAALISDIEYGRAQGVPLLWMLLYPTETVRFPPSSGSMEAGSWQGTRRHTRNRCSIRW